MCIIIKEPPRNFIILKKLIECFRNVEFMHELSVLRFQAHVDWRLVALVFHQDLTPHLLGVLQELQSRILALGEELLQPFAVLLVQFRLVVLIHLHIQIQQSSNLLQSKVSYLMFTLVQLKEPKQVLYNPIKSIQWLVLSLMLDNKIE